MKVGSIVVVLPFKDKIDSSVISYVKWLPADDERTPYMIRDIEICNDGSMSAVFEEGIIGYIRNKELSLAAEYIREIQPPEDITEIIEEALCEPMLL